MDPRRQFGICVFVVLASGCQNGPPTNAGATSGSAQTSQTGSAKPTIPPDYVPTPMGYSHRSCIVGVLPGETIVTTGVIRAVDGTTRTIPPCQYPTYDSKGRAILKAAQAAITGSANGDHYTDVLEGSGPRGNGATPQCLDNGAPCGFSFGGMGGEQIPYDWFSFFYVDNSKYGAHNYPYMGSVIATWTVPEIPLNEQADGFNFIWDGIVSANDGETLQPVLQFNTPNIDPCGQSFQWVYSIASWDWRSDYNYYESCGQEVWPGDQITGFAGVDTSRHYTVWAQRNGAWTNAWLDAQIDNASQFDQAVGGLLEVHRFNGYCSELPGGYNGNQYTNVVFSNIQVLDLWGNNLTPGSSFNSWVQRQNPDIGCNLSVGTGNTWGSLSWYDR